MNISYNWLKELISLEGEFPSTSQVSTTLTSLGLEVESIENKAKKYNGFYVGYVTEKVPHPDADKLNLCTVSLGDFEQTVVCGAPNVAKGQNIVLGTEGAVVPSAGFALSRRKIRGVESNGMICSKSELDLGDDHDGIWVLPQDAKVGQPLAEYLSMDDTVIEIAITPNRADCTGHIGVAREIAGYYGGKLTPPNPDIAANQSDEKIDGLLEIEIERDDLCPRYAAKIVKGVTVGESPQWLKSRLASCGVRSINNIVDVTNYLLMLTGQPLHAFDYDTVGGNKIIIGNVENGTEFLTLDSKNRKLDEDMLLIKDANGPVAVAGVMGGLDSEISQSSSNILIESAYFEPGTVRKTARKLGIHSDASYRYERGIDYGNVLYVADLAASMIAEIAGGQIVSGTIDAYPNPIGQKKVEVEYSQISKLLGLEIPRTKIKAIFEGLDFKYEEDELSLSVSSPSWRVDINLPIDLVEEVARVYGYDNLPISLAPSVDFSATAAPEKLSRPSQRDKTLNALVSFGLRQAMHPNQADPVFMKLYGKPAVVVANPLGAEMAVMRTNLSHSMLKTLNHNIRQGNESIKLFELGKVFSPVSYNNTFVEGFTETESLAVGLVGMGAKHWKSKPQQLDFYDIKGIWESLVDSLGISKSKLKPVKEPVFPFSIDSMGIYSGKALIGHLGMISKAARKQYDLDEEVYLLEVDLSSLYTKMEGLPKYRKVSQYPEMKRDFAFLVDKSVSAGQLLGAAEQRGGKFLSSAQIFDVFEDEKLGDKKSVAISLTFNSSERTLTDEEVKVASDKIIANAEKQFGAEIRG